MANSRKSAPFRFLALLLLTIFAAIWGGFACTGGVGGGSDGVGGNSTPTPVGGTVQGAQSPDAIGTRPDDPNIEQLLSHSSSDADPSKKEEGNPPPPPPPANSDSSDDDVPPPPVGRPPSHM